MPKNSTLGKARSNKQDEFYTQLTDIEKEMRYYRKHFRGKTVLCNCDDPFESNFFKYFVLNFNRLGLKKLICTCYDGSPIAGTEMSLFDDVIGQERIKNKPYKAIINTVYDKTGDGEIARQLPAAEAAGLEGSDEGNSNLLRYARLALPAFLPSR